MLQLLKASFSLLRYSCQYHIFQNKESLDEMTTRCHSLSLVFIRCATRYHSFYHLSVPVQLVVTRCVNRLSFYKRSAKTRFLLLRQNSRKSFYKFKSFFVWSSLFIYPNNGRSIFNLNPKTNLSSLKLVNNFGILQHFSVHQSIVRII